MADDPSWFESLGFTDRFRASFEPYAAHNSCNLGNKGCTYA